MTVTDVKKQIQSKRLDNFYIFTGEEIEAQRIYVDKMSEVSEKPIKRIEQVSESFNRRASLLKVSYCFVCRDDMDFWKSATNSDLIDELLGDNVLILLMTDIDKRSKAYKQYQDKIVTFEHMSEDVLYKYLQRECPLSDDRAFRLIGMCECDYGKMLLEADKVSRGSKALGISLDESFDYLVAEGTIHRPPKDAIFDFVDAMLLADIDKAFELLEECKGIGEPPLRVISVLYSNFRRVLQVQSCESSDICRTTGLSSWEVKIAKKSIGHWECGDLVFFLRILQSIEQGIKTGEIEEESALDLLMVSIL